MKILESIFKKQTIGSSVFCLFVVSGLHVIMFLYQNKSIYTPEYVFSIMLSFVLCMLGLWIGNRLGKRKEQRFCLTEESLDSSEDVTKSTSTSTKTDITSTIYENIQFEKLICPTCEQGEMRLDHTIWDQEGIEPVLQAVYKCSSNDACYRQITLTLSIEKAELGILGVE